MSIGFSARKEWAEQRTLREAKATRGNFLANHASREAFSPNSGTMPWQMGSATASVAPVGVSPTDPKCRSQAHWPGIVCALGVGILFGRDAARSPFQLHGSG